LGEWFVGDILQLELPVWDCDALRRRLETISREPIELTLTNNASTMMTYKPARWGRCAQVRLHRMFLSADAEVIEALAHWMNGRRRRTTGPIIDAFIAANRHRVERKPPSAVRLVTRGLHHDLRRYYHEVNRVEFDGALVVPITWGKLPSTRRRRSIRLGSYSADDHLIRIHPHLDQAFVPEFFVRYIVFHEMLHAQLGIEVGPTGRRRIHTREFNARERKYSDFARACAWQDDPGNLARLLRPAKRTA